MFSAKRIKRGAEIKHKILCEETTNGVFMKNVIRPQNRVFSLARVSAVSMYNSCLHFVENLFGRDQKKDSKKDSAEQNIYHERQVKELCALHALNNLFQDRNAFSKQALDNICHSLSPDNLVNPHKSMLGLGNYDVNVLMAALQQKGYEAVWFDKRKDPNNIDFSKIVGLILNIPSEMKFLPLRLNRKHWIAVKEIGNMFYNLDSKLDSPLGIGKETDLLSYLRDQIRCKDREIFVVVSQEIERSSQWQKDSHKRTDCYVAPIISNPSSCCPVDSTVAVIHLNSYRDRTNLPPTTTMNYVHTRNVNEMEGGIDPL